MIIVNLTLRDWQSITLWFMIKAAKYSTKKLAKQTIYFWETRTDGSYVILFLTLNFFILDCIILDINKLNKTIFTWTFEWSVTIALKVCLSISRKFYYIFPIFNIIFNRAK